MIDMTDEVAQLIKELNEWLASKRDAIGFNEVFEKISELRSPPLSVKETASIFMAFADNYPDTIIRTTPPYSSHTVIERLAQYSAAYRRPDTEWKELVASELETEPGKHDTAMESFIRKLHKILPSLNIDWLFTGRGTMRYQDQFDAEYWRTRFYDLQTSKYEARVREEIEQRVKLKELENSDGGGLYIQRGSRMSDKNDDFDAGFGSDEEALF